MAKQRQSAGGTERSVRRELLLIFVPALAAVVLMVLLGTFTTLPLWLTGIGAIAVLAAVTALLLIRQLRSNSARRGGEELNSVLSQVMLDGAKTQTSPMLICDEKEERKIENVFLKMTVDDILLIHIYQLLQDVLLSSILHYVTSRIEGIFYRVLPYICHELLLPRCLRRRLMLNGCHLLLHTFAGNENLLSVYCRQLIP